MTMKIVTIIKMLSRTVSTSFCNTDDYENHEKKNNFENFAIYVEEMLARFPAKI